VQALGIANANIVAGGGVNSFAILADGTPLAWGGGGRTGDGTDRDVLLPAVMPFSGPMDFVVATTDFAMAMMKGGGITSWGGNYAQKLGVPFPTQSATALKVRDPIATFANSDLVVEYYNATLRNINGVQGVGHYFFSSYPAEQVAIDNGAAGPGWVRTGRTFRAWNSAAKAPLGAAPVYRFYTATSNSHFFTASFAEYQSLLQQNPTNDPRTGWKYEAIAFYTVLSPDGANCPGGYYSIYRVYNKRFAQLDSNHRITPSYIDWARAVYFLGYADEGVAFCSPSGANAAADLHAWYIYPGLQAQSGDQVQALFVFSNNGPGSGNGGRVYMTLPPEVKDWSFTCYISAGTDCPASGDLLALKSGQAIANWPAGGVLAVLATGTAPTVAAGSNAALKFAALATRASGVPDANRANNAPPQSLTLVKSAQACTYAVSPTSLSLGATATQVQVSVLTGASCAWTVQNNASFIGLSGAGGTGSGTLTLTSQANASSLARTGSLTIAGQTLAVTQAGVPCTFTASPPSLALTSVAQQAQVAITAPPGCAWTARASAIWLGVAPASGSGSAVVTISAVANGGSSARTGAVSVGNVSIPIAQGGTVEAASAPPPSSAACSTLRLQRDGDQIAATGLSGESAVAVFADAVGNWSAQSDSPWLSVTAGGVGNGNGTIRYAVQPNNAPALRIGTIATGGKSFTVTQQGGDVSVQHSGSDSGGDTSGGGGGGGDGGGSGSSGGSSGGSAG
jgi:hypothetical protein